MSEQEKNESAEQSQQPPQSPVKSKTAALTETIDNQAAANAEREKITAEVVAKRQAQKQPDAGEVDEFGEPDGETKAAAVQAANDAIPVVTPEPEPEPEPSEPAKNTEQQEFDEVVCKMLLNHKSMVELKQAEVDALRDIHTELAMITEAIWRANLIEDWKNGQPSSVLYPSA